MVDFRAKLAEERAKTALDKELAEVAKATAPNMNPGRTGRGRREPEPPPPDISEFTLPPATRLKLSRLIMKRAEIGKQIGALRVESKNLTEEIKPLCKDYKLGKFQVNNTKVSYYSTNRPTIVKELLLANGVGPEVIAKCTVTKTIWQLKVSAPGSIEEDVAEWTEE